MPLALSFLLIAVCSQRGDSSSTFSKVWTSDLAVLASCFLPPLLSTGWNLLITFGYLAKAFMTTEDGLELILTKLTDYWTDLGEGKIGFVLGTTGVSTPLIFFFSVGALSSIVFLFRRTLAWLDTVGLAA